MGFKAMRDMSARERGRYVLRRGLLYLAVLAIGLSMALPLFWMVSTSLKEPHRVFSATPQWVPEPITTESYRQIWRVVDFGKYFLNSVAVALAVTLGLVSTSACSAYAFARLRFPGRERLFFAYLATLMIPGAVTMIPTFVLMKLLGWVNTYKSLILPGIFTAFGTFLLRQFFLSIPSELEDAARIDGASPYRIFWSIILPLAKPALVALTISTFMGNWQSFMWPLLLIDSEEKYTLPVGLAYLQDQYQFSSPNWPLIMTGSLLALLPIVVVFMLSQRFFLQGIRMGQGTQRGA
jgi:multiple sugar transport system permease protein